MAFFSAIKEFAHGLKLGASYTINNRHGYVEKITAPKIHINSPGH